MLQALQSENANIPAGSIDLGSRSFSLKTSGSYTSLDEVRDTVVAVADGRTVRVRDVADVSWDTQEHGATSAASTASAPCSSPRTRKTATTSSTSASASMPPTRFETQLPKRINLELGFDQSENVSTGSTGCTDDFGIAIALVSLTLLPLVALRGGEDALADSKML